MTAGGDSGGALTPSSSHAPLRKKQNNRVDADPVILVSPPTKNNVYREYICDRICPLSIGNVLFPRLMF